MAGALWAIRKVIDENSREIFYAERFEDLDDTEELDVRRLWNLSINERKQGLGTIIDVNTTSNNLLQARYDLLKARMNYITQKRMVEFYKGVPLQTKVHE